MLTKEIQQLVEHAEVIKNDGAHAMHTMEAGDEWRQGDVRVIRLPDDAVEEMDNRIKAIERFNGQVAPGTTTGSRHVFDSIDGVVAYALIGGNALDGPIIATSKPRTLSHPEHGNCVDLPPGCYAFPGQRVYAEELRRTLD
ncbi:MAG: hypothetical protein AAGI37_19560 [Planctomycetota bacterium]